MELHGLRLQTTDQELLADAEYKKIIQIVNRLWNTNVIQRGNGYCVSMSDMIRLLLSQEGIECDLVECKLTIMKRNPPGLFLIGHSGQVENFFQEVDTHVVAITKTKIPLIIDLSVCGLVPIVPYICERLTNSHPNEMLRIDFGHSEWVYERKESNKLPRMHQKSILDRFKTDRKVERSLYVLKLWAVVMTVIIVLNALRGGYDFYRIYIRQDVFPNYSEVIEQQELPPQTE